MAISIKALVGALVGVVVGLALLPTVINQVGLVNVTGVVGGTLVGLIPMAYILIIFGGAIAYVTVASR